MSTPIHSVVFACQSKPEHTILANQADGSTLVCKSPTGIMTYSSSELHTIGLNLIKVSKYNVESLQICLIQGVHSLDFPLEVHCNKYRALYQTDREVFPARLMELCSNKIRAVDLVTIDTRARGPELRGAHVALT